MTYRPLPIESSLKIKTPCPKDWNELTGDEAKRFCSSCSLHVHNAAQMSRAEAQELITDSTSRVCMRMEFDAQGAPIFRDSKPSYVGPVVADKTPVRRWARWAMSAAAGVLAACHGSIAPVTGEDPSGTPSAGQTSKLMGEVCTTTLMGSVDVPDPQPSVRMGEMEAISAPTSPANDEK